MSCGGGPAPGVRVRRRARPGAAGMLGGEDAVREAAGADFNFASTSLGRGRGHRVVPADARACRVLWLEQRLSPGWGPAPAFPGAGA